MTSPRLLRILAGADVAAGAAALAAAPWLADQLDVRTTAVRIVGALLIVLGVETSLLAARTMMAKVTVAIEAVSALVAIDVLLLAEPTATGSALLVATAAWSAAAAAELVLLQRTRTGALVAS